MSKKTEQFGTVASDNPLINPPSLPHGAPAFDKIKTAHFEPAIDWALGRLQDEIDAIKNNEDTPSFENTIEALELAGEDLGRIHAILNVYTGNNATDEIRDLEVKVNAKLSPVFSDISMDEVLFERIKTVYDAKDTKELDPEQAMLLENTYKQRARSGALLPAETKARLKEISAALSDKTTQFSQNVVKASASFERIAEASELKGVPERSLKTLQSNAQAAIDAAEQKAIKSQGAWEALSQLPTAHFKSKKIATETLQIAQKNAEKALQSYEERKAALDGKYLIKMQPFPSEILSHCENRELRKEISQAHGSLAAEGPYDNRGLVMDIVKLRHERAQILGFKNHAELILSDRMAGSVETVDAFLENNLSMYKPAAEAFFNEVKTYAESIGTIDSFESHDMGFYSRKLREERFNFDSEVLRPYFEIGNVLDGFRNHVEKLFNVEMVDCTDQYPAYRDDAQVFEVQDKASGETIALFYADYFADADAKRGGAWMSGFRDRMVDKHGHNNIPLITNSCNYQKPSADQPSLLSLDEVRTLFHEGGHAFHGILAEGKYGSLNGTNVKWDFVELPSQLMENWLSEPEVLKTFAKHHETGEPIPDEYIKKIQEMENYGSANAGLGQTHLGLLDLMWHTTDPEEITSPEAIEDAIHDKVGLFPQRESLISGRFGHLFSDAVGYSAGYYSYKWAEVLEADVYEEFKRNGLYDKSTAKRLKDTIYSQGGKQNPMDLFKAMMGREPNPEALYRREGLLSDADKAPANDTGAAPHQDNNDLDAPEIG